MSPLMRTLYDYVMAYHFDPSHTDPEYDASVRYAQCKEQKLLSALDQEGQQLLEDMIAELTQSHFIELETMFRSTLALSRELAALVRP